MSGGVELVVGVVVFVVVVVVVVVHCDAGTGL